MKVVEYNGYELSGASEDSRGDQNFVKEAIKNCNSAFEFASDKLKYDIGLITLLNLPLMHSMIKART